MLGHRLTGLLAEALGCPSHLAEHYTADPTILLRIFNYPPEVPLAADTSNAEELPRWGVGEHTDYGLLTILKQDTVGGLQIRYGERWVEVPEVPGSFVCNVGDVLEGVTRGRYRSAPHRVRNTSALQRISVPFFFDPSFDAKLVPLPLNVRGSTARPARDLPGTYGEYLVSKVARVFPELGHRVLD